MPKVLITGGSRGIGLAFAEYYAKEGYDIYLCARNMLKLMDVKKHLEDTYDIRCCIFQIDLSEKGKAKQLYDSAGSDIDVLINNAGCGYTGYSEQIDIEKEEDMVMVNDAALMSLTKFYLTDMMKRHEGTIINIASTGAFQPGPYIAGYYASKAFVLSYTEAIHEEAKPYNVKVYCLCPGPAATDFYSASDLKIPKHAQSAESVVRYTMKHLKNSCVIIPGFANRLVRFIPRRIRISAIKKMKANVLRKKERHF